MGKLDAMYRKQFFCDDKVLPVVHWIKKIHSEALNVPTNLLREMLFETANNSVMNEPRMCTKLSPSLDALRR